MIKLAIIGVLVSLCNCFAERLLDGDQFLRANFEVANKHLPLFLQDTLRSSFIDSIFIRMGSRATGSMRNIPQNGISLQVVNRTGISAQTLAIIQSLFSVSVDQLVYVPQIRTAFIANPNDKLCAEHLHEVFTNILPCRDKSGLAELFPLRNIFKGGYIGLQIVWSSQLMNITLIVQKKGSMANIAGVKVRPCELFDESKERGLVKEMLSKPKHMQVSGDEVSGGEVEFQRYCRDRWYGPKKAIVHRIDVSGMQFERVVLPVVLPYGFQLTNVEATFEGRTIPFQFEVTLQDKSKDTLIVMSFKNISQVIVTVEFEAKMLGFQHYESIAGGGEEFMALPLLIVNSKGGCRQIFGGGSISVRLLQPDFSIPFHTMTFTIAILGYLWIGLWKAYFAQEKE